MLNKETKIPKGRGKKMVVPSENITSIASYLQGILLCLLHIPDPDSQPLKALQPCLVLLVDSSRNIVKLFRAFIHFDCHTPQRKTEKTATSSKEN